MPYSNDWLQEQLQQGKTFNYLYFWGHRTRKDGIVTASCLSQWYPRGFTHEGIRYATAEHWMMAGKARLFKDEDILAKILATENPAVAKKLGRQVKDFDLPTWKENMREIVTMGSYHKFRHNQDLREFLDTTGTKVLVEASPYDPLWGIGMSAVDAESFSPAEWKGTNWLGWCLMEARDLLRKS